MLKEVIVTFSFDTETESVSNVKCSVGGVEKKPRTTKSSKSVLEEGEEPIMKLEEKKISFNGKAVSMMQLEPENRVIIQYEKGVDNKMYPVIGRDIDFDQEGNGNKVTKSFTVAYRGNANTILSQYGTEFTFSPTKNEGIFKLVAIAGGTPNVATEPIETLIEMAEKIEPELIVEDIHETEIEETLLVDRLTFTL